jgi:SAM-dependent methyltransferase
MNRFSLYRCYLEVLFYTVYELLFLIVFYYWRSTAYFRDDLLLRAHYWRRSPYQLVKDASASRKSEPTLPATSLLFGQTLIPTLAQIARIAKISQEDHVAELGCGTGVGCFWLAYFTQARVTGLDLHPSFIRNAQVVAYRSEMRNRLHFLNSDFRLVSFQKFSVIYFYSTSFSEEFLKGFFPSLLRQLPIGARIITVSSSIQDYLTLQEQNCVHLLSQTSQTYPWGKATVFVHALVSSLTEHASAKN